MVNVINSCLYSIIICKTEETDNFIVEGRSLRNMLSNIGPNIDSCGTPDINGRKSLKKF